MGQVYPTSELEQYLKTNPETMKGCFVDTNLLFAADYEIHSLHEVASTVTDLLYRKGIPIFANSVIRSELLELKRRVFVTEGLVDLPGLTSENLPATIKNKISSLNTRIRKRENDGRHFLLSGREIKEFKNIFETDGELQSWEIFCKLFLKDRLHLEWQEILAGKKVKYVGTSSEILTSEIEWEPMVDIIEASGIGVSDAMIVNFFLNSEIDFMVSGDSEIASAFRDLETEKVLFSTP